VTRRPILLLGGTGQIGFELRRALAPLSPVIAPRRAELDLAQLPALPAFLRACAPAIIVNAAAYTAVDAAERNRAEAFVLNAEMPAILAEEARRSSIPLVHYSTDYVFDGRRPSPYVETDAAAPLNVYGESKREGELAVVAGGGPHLILRTSWIYAARGRNFLLTIRRLAAEREELAVVDDQTGAPTWARMVAEATAQILAQCRAPDGSFDLASCSGIFHLSAAGATTWHGFAAAILGASAAPRLRAITSEAFGRVALRPRYSVLSNAAFQRTFGLALPSWEEQLRLCLEELG
jgi:dTDP-4-dehydrorhamnose reductase